MKKIDPSALLPMNLAAGIFPLRVDLAYAADAPPNIFGAVYHPDAQLWLHHDLAQVVLLASDIAAHTGGYRFVLYDGLRTVEAQDAMAQSEIVRQNPHWLEPPRLLSPPGAGAHPRGMAIDIALVDDSGALVDMGTGFDHLAEDSSPQHNPAHREYVSLTPEHAQNRAILDKAMREAADLLGVELCLLPQEWWDFRLPEEVYSGYAPLSDVDLPPEMRMVAGGARLKDKRHYEKQFIALRGELEPLFAKHAARYLR